MLRSVIASALAATLIAAAAAPAFAGPAETAFLQKLTANWTGRGKLSGAQTGPVACRIVTSVGGQTLKYQGRCNIPDVAAQAFNGSIAYNDRLKRYEARSVGGTVPGIRRGNSLIFTTKSSTMGGRSYSTMTMSPSAIIIDFSIIDGHGDKTTSRITFSR
ncbi:MAG TPA: hypothetical protein VHA07_07325 [Devosia sp.]|nr:hypothetical protein [Devosia sp.]